MWYFEKSTTFASVVLHLRCKEKKQIPCNCLTVHCPAWLLEVVNDTEFTLGGLVCFQPSMTPEPATGPYPSLILSSSQPEILFLKKIKLVGTKFRQCPGF